MESGDIVAAADVMTDLGLDGKEMETKVVTAAGDLDGKPSETVKQVMTEAIDLGRLLESIETQAYSVKELVAVLRAIEESRAADDHRLKDAEIQLKAAHLEAVTGRMDRERLVWEEERRERQRDRAWAQLGWFTRARYVLIGKGRGSLEVDTASSSRCSGCCVRANSDNHATAVVKGVTDSADAAAAGLISSASKMIVGTTNTIMSSPCVEKSATLDGAPLTAAITTTSASASAAKEKEEGKKEEDEDHVASLTVESKPVEAFRRGKRSVRFAIWRRK